MSDFGGHAISVNEEDRQFRRKAEQLRKGALQVYHRRKDVSGARTLLAEDAGFLIKTTDASDIVWTMPNDLYDGFHCAVIMGGAGRPTFTPDTGATVNSTAATDRIIAQYGRVIIEVVGNSDGASADYVISGDVG